MFVQGLDGKFYKNPSFFGKDYEINFTWDGIFAKIRIFDKSTEQSVARRLKAVLKDLGLKKVTYCFEGHDNTLFEEVFRPCNTYRLKVNEQISAPDHHEGVVEPPPPFDASVIWITATFDKEILIEAVEGKNQSSHLLLFVHGELSYGADITEKVKDYLPGIKRFKKNPLKWFDDKPERITLVK